jgi:hypothetical protein
VCKDFIEFLASKFSYLSQTRTFTALGHAISVQTTMLSQLRTAFCRLKVSKPALPLRQSIKAPPKCQSLVASFVSHSKACTVRYPQISFY